MAVAEDFLVGLMALSGHEHDVAGLGKGGRGSDGFPTVDDAQAFSFLDRVEPGLHVRGDEDPIDVNDIVRLTMSVEDLDDCADVEFEDYVGVGEIAQVGFGLFPNPADAVVEVVLDELLLGAEVRIRDMGGRLVRHEQVQGKLARMDVSNLTPCIYTVEVSGSGARSIERLSIR